MTPEERIRPYVVATHRKLWGIPSLPNVEDNPGKLFRENPDLLAYAEAEVRRLRESTKRGVLAETDYESKIRCQALERMISVYRGTGHE